jgi:hypothetical protein
MFSHQHIYIYIYIKMWGCIHLQDGIHGGLYEPSGVIKGGEFRE